MKLLFDDRLERSNVPARAGALRFEYVGNPFQLLKLRTVQAIYFVQQYNVPRPKALLGDEHFKKLLAQIITVRDLSPKDAFKTLYISAAGSDSSVMTRLKEELAAKTGLAIADEEGDLLIRVRKTKDGDGWETLVRISPRPQATRAWRVCNREGALNAPVAYAMNVLSQPTDEDVYLNMGCGSGTLLIERMALGEVKSIVGYDHDPVALECAGKNIEAAGYSEIIKRRQGNITDLPLSAKSVDVITADLPFGQLVGSHDDNLTLYPGLLNEAARLLKPDGRMVLVSHEVRLLDSLLENSANWKIEQNLRISVSGMHPRIWVLSRKQ
ncbi:MAG: methyltransferase domain-containing protein [Anaerolineaceae bacterium]|nr:methyltransferase domain-containing protein [Anaerolineaceae bacterium]